MADAGKDTLEALRAEISGLRSELRSLATMLEQRVRPSGADSHVSYLSPRRSALALVPARRRCGAGSAKGASRPRSTRPVAGVFGLPKRSRPGRRGSRRRVPRPQSSPPRVARGPGSCPSARRLDPLGHGAPRRDPRLPPIREPAPAHGLRRLGPQRVLERRRRDAWRDRQDRQRSRAAHPRRGGLELPPPARRLWTGWREVLRHQPAGRGGVRTQGADPAPSPLRAPRRPGQGIAGRRHGRRSRALRFRLGAHDVAAEQRAGDSSQGGCEQRVDGATKGEPSTFCATGRYGSRTRDVRARQFWTAHCHAARPIGNPRILE